MNDINRKKPKQARSKRTVQTILKATAQILAEEGSQKLTTNYLASRTGLSIGTIYQYFPDKVAIILALAEKQREETSRQIDALLSDKEDLCTEDKIRLIIHTLPSPSGHIARTIINVCKASEEGASLLNSSEMFVLTHMLTEIMRQAALRATPLLGSEEFEAAVLRMVMGFLHEK